MNVWLPHCKKAIATLERILRRTIEMIPGLKQLSCDDRLKQCGFTTLKTWRTRSGQIEVFKTVHFLN